MNNTIAIQAGFTRLPFASADPAGPAPTMEFHVSRKARDKYQFDLTLFTAKGKVIFANFHAAQLFAQKVNAQRDLVNSPEQAVSAAEINAMGLIDEIMHILITQYRESIKPGVFAEALDWLETHFSPAEVEKTLRIFVEEFPPLDVYLEKINVADYLKGQTDGVANRQIALEEMLLLWLANLNPAFSRYQELFDDAPLREQTRYGEVMEEVYNFFDTQPLFGPAGGEQNLIRLLRLPAQQSPGSLTEQLRFMRDHWGMYLSGAARIKWELLLGKAFMETWGVPGQPYDVRLLRGMDFISEEQKIRFNPGLGTAPTHVPDYAYADDEPEQFSPDMHWMPRLVLMAKSTLVWLDQLSKKYQRPIRRLDEIPDEEIDQLARWGFTGLWLIGIWERSKASQKIKHMCGNPEAEASAYALDSYTIANELGGDAAYSVLRDRCWQRGIRLASDMVPNHTGVVSKWMVEHPDWFVQLPYPPFPSYDFNSADLSEHPDIGIYLEKHYYDRTDAAVVFKWHHLRNGVTRYIYHGNDGTSMPWNDTAQLNYLNPQVREAVIQTILEVARRFPIIRFDAAMTLAKRHYQRLWYPEPGSGGDIPSRAEYGLTKAQFDAAMPVEFWREVVDRVAQEAPDTLLLAEAFWMMEGYFVRTLGMHRVYNSAFMNMLKNEENKKYRYTIKNTIEFEPEVLKRYVNFMNNPDEETAVNQFGDGDKYFGICMMMATMPGLPMFGHGQVEGFREKYGMEYRRAYHDEAPNPYLVSRHEREIFPLLKKRYLFAEVEHFLLYDLYNPNGSVNENVFAYSNRYRGERTLVVFHNAYADCRGWIRTSAAFSEKDSEGQSKVLRQRTLGEGLALPSGEDDYLIFRDQINGLEYIYHARTLWEQGMYIELGAYKYQVFLDFREVRDDASRSYARLNASLQGRGVPSIDEALQELHLQPIHQALREFVNPDFLQQLLPAADTVGEASTDTRPDEAILDDLETRYQNFLEAGKAYGGFQEVAAPLARQVRREVEMLWGLNGEKLRQQYAPPGSRKFKAAAEVLDARLDATAAREVLLCWTLFHRLGAIAGNGDSTAHSRTLLDEWLIHKVVRNTLTKLGLNADEAAHAGTMLKLLTACQGWFDEKAPKKDRAHALLARLLRDPEVQHLLQVNRFNEVLWFNQEGFGTLAGWLFVIGVAGHLAAAPAETAAKPASAAGRKKKTPAPEATGKTILAIYEVVEKWQKAEAASEYQVEKLLAALKGPSRRKAAASGKKAKAVPAKSSRGKAKKPAKSTKDAPAKPKTAVEKKRAVKPKQDRQDS